MDESLKRTIILDHYQNPHHKGLVDDNSYIKVNMNNESCIDEIDLMVKIENGQITDVRFDGEACAICTSSASILTDTMIGKTLDEAKKICNNFKNMIDEKDYDSDILKQAIVYDNISKQPNRKKCALLSWWGMEKIMEDNNEKKEKS